MKKIIYLSFLIIITLFCSCEKQDELNVSTQTLPYECPIISLDENYNELFTEEELDGYTSIAEELVSDISIGFNNNDGTKSLFVFSTPIFYLNDNFLWSMIDTRITNVSQQKYIKKGYYYKVVNNDIESYYSDSLSKEKGIYLKKKENYSCGIYSDNIFNGEYVQNDNFIDENRSMIKYSNPDSNYEVYTYPSSLGSNCEIKLVDKITDNSIKMWVKVDDDIELQEQPGGYINLIKQDNDTNVIIGVIQKPITKTINGDYSFLNNLNIIKESNEYYILDFKIDDISNIKDTIIFTSFEIRREKQADNCIYSNFPDLEYSFLSNYSVVGNSDYYGIGRLMVRFNFTKNFKLTSDRIKNVEYSVYSLNINQNNSLNMVQVLEEWCSILGNWNNNYKTGEVISKTYQKSNIFTFDITEQAKIWSNDKTGQQEFNGLQIRCSDETNGNYILLSNDNSLFYNFTKIILNY